jgi:hypothetical protein
MANNLIFSKTLFYSQYCERYSRGRQSKGENITGAWDLLYSQYCERYSMGFA